MRFDSFCPGCRVTRVSTTLRRQARPSKQAEVRARFEGPDFEFTKIDWS
jgi:hypothetical protein